MNHKVEQLLFTAKVMFACGAKIKNYLIATNHRIYLLLFIA